MTEVAAITQREEALRRDERTAVGRLHLGGDDDAVVRLLVQARERSNDQVANVRIERVHVELGEERRALPGVEIDEDDRRIRGERLVGVLEARQARRRHAGLEPREQRRRHRESVVPIERCRIDRDLVLVRRHRRERDVDAITGLGRRVLLQVRRRRPGQHAPVAIDRIAHIGNAGGVSVIPTSGEQNNERDELTHALPPRSWADPITDDSARE